MSRREFGGRQAPGGRIMPGGTDSARTPPSGRRRHVDRVPIPAPPRRTGTPEPVEENFKIDLN